MREWKCTGPRTSVTLTPRRSSGARVRRMTRGTWQPLPISRCWGPTPASPVEMEARSWRRHSPGPECPIREWPRRPSTSVARHSGCRIRSTSHAPRACTASVPSRSTCSSGSMKPAPKHRWPAHSPTRRRTRWRASQPGTHDNWTSPASAAGCPSPISASRCLRTPVERRTRTRGSWPGHVASRGGCASVIPRGRATKSPPWRSRRRAPVDHSTDGMRFWHVPAWSRPWAALLTPRSMPSRRVSPSRRTSGRTRSRCSRRSCC